MNLLQKLADIYKDSTVTITMTFKDENFSMAISQQLDEGIVPPFVLSGKNEELNDEVFIETLEAPLENASGIIHNIKAVGESIKKKEKEKLDKAKGNKSNSSSKPKKSVAQDEVESKQEEKQAEMPIGLD